MRKTTKCTLCGRDISLSNISKHTGSKSCKGEYRPSPYPWDDWKIGKDLFRLPCGYEGTKSSCRNKLNSSKRTQGSTNLSGFNEKRKLGLVHSWNKGGSISEEQKIKISNSLKNYNASHTRPKVSDISRKKMSESRKAMLSKHPENHPSRLLAGNRAKMTYPERVAFGKLKKMGVEFQHQKRIDRFYVDFLVGSNTVIEIDGERWHSSPEQIDRDKNRDDRLSDLGFKVFRIKSNERIETRIEEIIANQSVV